jgi:hypothetical protein
VKTTPDPIAARVLHLVDELSKCGFQHQQITTILSSLGNVRAAVADINIPKRGPGRPKK